MTSDLTLLALLALCTAMFGTCSVAQAYGLWHRHKRGAAVMAIVCPPAAAWVAYSNGMRGRALGVVVSLVAYLAVRALG